MNEFHPLGKQQGTVAHQLLKPEKLLEKREDIPNWAYSVSLKEAVGFGYLEIVDKRKNKKFNQNHKDFQLYRRGRYVEFNLLYDRGTLFGLQSSGRVDSILMSMPPVVKWSTKKSALLIKYENALKKYL